jgi:hypothetical protein
MLRKMARHAVVGIALVTVGSVATASSLGLLTGRTGRAEVELLDGRPVLSGDLGEIVVVAKADRAH